MFDTDVSKERDILDRTFDERVQCVYRMPSASSNIEYWTRIVK